VATPKILAIRRAEVSPKDKAVYDLLVELGKPQFCLGTKILEFEYLLKFSELVVKYSRKLQAEAKNELVASRREALNDGDEEKYAQIVREMMSREQQITDETLEAAAKMIGLDANEIEEQIQDYTNNDEEKAVQLMNLQKKVQEDK